MARLLPGRLTMVLLAGLVLLGSTPARGQADPEPPKASAEAVDERTPVDVPPATEKAMEFYNGGMILWAFNRVWGLALPAVLAFSGFSARLRDLASRLGWFVWFLTFGIVFGLYLRIPLRPLLTSSDRSARLRLQESRLGCFAWFFTVGIYIVLYLGIVFLIELPLDYYQGFVRLHAYGLSNQTLEKWLKDSALDLVIGMFTGFLLLWVPYLLMSKAPRRWWLYTGLGSVPLLFFVVLVKPVWIDPLFNEFGPMKDKQLEQSILDLASRAGIASSRVFEVEKSVDTKAVNAYVTGFLDTKRIVLWDTLLAKLDEPEVLFVMVHEMGHYVLGHVVRSVVLSSLATILGLYFVHAAGGRLIRRFRDRLGFDRLSDVASVPLMIMLLQVSSLVLGPAVMAYSRIQEHEADRFALDLTHANRTGGTAFVKLQTENLGNPRPGWVYRLFRASHPSIGERVDFCNEYRPWDAPDVSKRSE